MSTTLVQSPSPSTSKEFWVQLEIPYELYLDNWEEDHKSRLEELVDGQGGLLKRHIKPHWDLTQDKKIPKKNLAIQNLATDQPEWAAALLSAYEFSRNTNKEQVLSRLRQVSTDEDNLQSYIDVSLDKGDKKLAIILLDLLEADRLKDIYVMTQLRRTTPVNTYSVSGTNSPLNDLESTELLDELQEKSREFNDWHQFESDGSSYLIIKVHEEDGVQIQPDTNAAVEEAELLILKSKESDVQVYTQDQNLLGATQRGIRDGIEAGNDDIHSCTVTSSKNTVSHADYSAAIDKISTNQTGPDLVLDKIHIENAPLKGSPKIKMSDAIGGMSKALDELEAADINLLGDPDSIEMVSFDYKGKKYRLYPEEDDNNIKIRYHGSINDDELLSEFESEIQDQLGVSLTLEKK